MNKGRLDPDTIRRYADARKMTVPAAIDELYAMSPEQRDLVGSAYGQVKVDAEAAQILMDSAQIKHNLMTMAIAAHEGKTLKLAKDNAEDLRDETPLPEPFPEPPASRRARANAKAARKRRG